MQANLIQDYSELTPRGKKINNYLLVNQLGKGQFGVVWRATHLQNGNTYAVKVINKKKLNQNPLLVSLLKTEVAIMHTIDHPNILHLYDYLESPNNYYLVIKYCNQGDFENYLKKNNMNKISEEKAIYFLKQIMNGFQELRKHKVLHRDFKLANIFVHDEILIIGDFGFAKMGTEIAETLLGTPLTQAYEILTANGSEGVQYNSKADLWSIGVVYYQMLYGEYPFMGNTIKSLIKNVKEKVQNFQFPTDTIVSEESKDLIRKLLQPDPIKRISFYQFFNHQVFEKQGSQISQIHQKMFNKDREALELLGRIIKKKLQIDEMFQNNKQTSQDNIEFMNGKDLVQYGKNNQLEAKKIDEEEQADQVNIQKYQQKSFLQIVLDRYKHEKNKIFYIIFTVKKLQKILKINQYPTLNHVFYQISLLLIKKAEILNYCNLELVQERKNVFQFPNYIFQSVVKSIHFKEIISLFETDKKKITEYVNIILSRMKSNNIPVPFVQLIIDQNPDLLQIDNTVLKMTMQLRYNFSSPEMNFKTNEDRRDYLFIIYNIQNSVYSEKTFPFIVNPKYPNQGFNWNQFYIDHEQITLYQLKTYLLIKQLKKYTILFKQILQTIISFPQVFLQSTYLIYISHPIFYLIQSKFYFKFQCRSTTPYFSFIGFKSEHS